MVTSYRNISESTCHRLVESQFDFRDLFISQFVIYQGLLEAEIRVSITFLTSNNRLCNRDVFLAVVTVLH